MLPCLLTECLTNVNLIVTKEMIFYMLLHFELYTVSYFQGMADLLLLAV